MKVGSSTQMSLGTDYFFTFVPDMTGYWVKGVSGWFFYVDISVSYADRADSLDGIAEEWLCDGIHVFTYTAIPRFM